jgi:hypothetical protein
MGRVYINETNVCSGRLGLYRTPQPTLKNVKDRKERELSEDILHYKRLLWR